MSESMEQIVALLGEELKLYRELLAVVEDERDCLVGRRHNELPQINERKMAVCNQLTGAQKERRELMMSLAPGSQQPPKLSELADLLPQEERASYKARVRDLRAIAQRLSQLTDANKNFLEEALNTVEHLIGILMGKNRQTSYNRSGMVQPRGMPRFMAREA